MTKISSDLIRRRVDAYAEWVEKLRKSLPVPILAPTRADPLSRLGRELQLLADTYSQRDRELLQLFELVGSVEQGVQVKDVLNRIYDGFKGLIPFERLGCAFLSDNGEYLTAYWARSELGPVQISDGYTRPVHGSSLEAVLNTGYPRILNDLEEYLKIKPDSDATRRIVREGGRASLTCPLLVDHRPIGVLFFTTITRNAYLKTHQSMYLQIASQVSAAIENSRAYLKIVERNTRLLEEKANLSELASRDALTGVLNRREITRTAALAIGEGVRTKASVGIIMVDIDHFKQINDCLGHGAGDEVLKEFTRRIASVMRKSDLLGRYGGEEFLIVVAAPITIQTLGEASERLRQAIVGTPFRLGTETRVLSASFGAAISGDENASIESLVADADRSLYAAKHRGRNRVVMLSAEVGGDLPPNLAA